MFKCGACQSWFLTVDESVPSATYRHVEREHARHELPITVETELL